MWNGVQSEDLDTVSTSILQLQQFSTIAQRITLWKTQIETSNTKPISTIVEIESNGVTLKQTMKTYTKKIR
jgi:hypothetical protein